MQQRRERAGRGRPAWLGWAWPWAIETCQFIHPLPSPGAWRSAARRPGTSRTTGATRGTPASLLGPPCRALPCNGRDRIAHLPRRARASGPTAHARPRPWSPAGSARQAPPLAICRCRPRAPLVSSTPLQPSGWQLAADRPRPTACPASFSTPAEKEKALVACDVAAGGKRVGCRVSVGAVNLGRSGDPAAYDRACG